MVSMGTINVKPEKVKVFQDLAEKLVKVNEWLIIATFSKASKSDSFL